MCIPELRVHQVSCIWTDIIYLKASQLFTLKKLKEKSNNARLPHVLFQTIKPFPFHSQIIIST